MERRRGRNDREEPSRSTINILLIDDHDEDRARIARVITRDVAPVEIFEVSDHVGFYQALQENRFHIVITEQELHWSSGLEVVTAVKSLRPAVPVIMVTRSEDEIAAATALREGVEAYLVKRGDLDARLRTSLRSALRRLEFEERIGSLEGRLQDLLERLDVGVFRVAMDGTLLETNTSFEKLVGVAGTEGGEIRKLGDLFAEPEVYRELTDRLSEEGQVRSFQARWVRADGSPIWVALSETIERRSEGELVVEGLVEDVTAVRDAQEAVRKVGDDLRAVLEHSGAAIAVLDAEGTVTMVNSAFERFSGFSRTEVEGVFPWSRFMSIADGERAAERRRVLLAAPESGPRSGRFDFVTRDGRVCRAHVTEAVLPGGERSVVSLLNISERQRVEDRMMFNAFHDGLTGLPNRLSLMDRLDTLLKPPAKVRRRGTALILLDVDRFKAVNDRFGPRIGDLLLRSVNRRIEGAVPEIDTMARAGSDTFAVVLHPVDESEEAIAAAAAINGALEAPFRFGDHTVHCTASLGVAMAIDGREASALFRDAEFAMYESKRAGGGRWSLFDPTMEERAVSRRGIEAGLERVIADARFEVRYRPIVDLDHRSISGFEAVPSWRLAVGGPVDPERLIRIAEESGLMVPAGREILQASLHALAELRIAGEGREGLRMAVNLTASMLRQASLVGAVREAVEGAGIEPGDLQLEVDESVIVGADRVIEEAFAGLSDLGVRLCVDHFGAGPSVLQVLHRFPFSVVKTDPGFLRDTGEGEPMWRVLEGVLGLVAGLHMEVIADGIRNAEQASRLLDLGCTLGQGSFLAETVDGEEADRLISICPAW